jgi:hypothetical protein
MRRRSWRRIRKTWWDNSGVIAGCWAVYQPKGAKSFAASLMDLSGNGNHASVGVAPDWDATNGWKFNGIDHYLTTTFIPALDGSQDQSMFVAFTNITGADGCLAGFTQASSKRWWLLANNDGNECRYGNGADRDVKPNLTEGVLAVAGNQGYRNGVANGSTFGPWGGPPTRTTYIGAANIGFAGWLLSGYIQALVIYNVALSADDVATVSAAMAALYP